MLSGWYDIESASISSTYGATNSSPGTQDAQQTTLGQLASSEIWKELDALTSDNPAGLNLFCQYGVVTELYFLERGLVKLMRTEENGREIIVGLRSPGALLGLAAAIAARPHPFAAVTVTRCRLVRLAAREFIDLLSRDRGLSACVREVLSAEVLEQAERISQIVALPARYRLEQLLWELYRTTTADRESHGRLQLPLRHAETAQLLAITPAYLSNLFRELEREQILRRAKGWIVITKPERLRHPDLED